jgi:pSer/pThr/pTyr-binding forkhead associated (FHA) protein/type II secretory pathway predicted ATPase ExeA
LFIEQYKLESNPFVPDAARPTFASHSSRYAMLKLDDLFNKQIHCLFLSGPAGVGKTTLVRQRFRMLRDISVSWLNPLCETEEQMLLQLLGELGPGEVEGTAIQQRNILEVFLRHQAGNGRYSYIAVDGLERFSAAALRELEVLSQLRFRKRPIVYILVLARNEELVANLLPQYNLGPLARAVHQRLAGFTLEETRSYLRACLQGAGCNWAEELIPEEVVLDIQAFTQGVVGDVNAVACGALDALAARAEGGNRQPKLTRAILKEIGTQLNLRYDLNAWAPINEEILSADAVHLSDPAELKVEAARLLVSSGRKVVAEITLNRPRMVLGRDDSCDISLDSRYVSRYQNLFMETPDGWLLIDLSSTNGCFVNGRRVREHRLRDGDLIAVGHHQLRFSGPAKLTRNGEAVHAVAESKSEPTLETPTPSPSPGYTGSAAAPTQN